MKHTSYLGMWMIWSWEMYPLSNERHRILVHEWDMKLGVVPLQSARKDLSNDVLKVDFNVGHIFEAGNCAVVISMKTAFKRCRHPPMSMVFHDLGSKFNLQQNGHHLNAPFMLITMVQIPPQYHILSPRYLAKYIVQTSISLILGWYPRIFFCGFNFSLGITTDALSTKPLCPWQRSSTQAAYSGA